MPKLASIIKSHTCYPLSLRCKVYVLSFPGVTVLLEPPPPESVATNLTNAEAFPVPVEPSDAMVGTDPTSIGFSFEISDDPSIRRYGMT